MEHERKRNDENISSKWVVMVQYESCDIIGVFLHFVLLFIYLFIFSLLNFLLFVWALQVEIVNSLSDEFLSTVPYTGKYTSQRTSEVWVGVTHADGAKCERCWNYSPQVGSFVDHPTLCARCYGVVDVQPLPAAAGVC